MLATSVAQCDANAESVATAWGERFIRCETRRGLRSFTDREGVTRWYCAAIAHRHNVERRFGRQPYEVEDGIAAAKAERERAW
jgi:hypothetical protein